MSDKLNDSDGYNQLSLMGFEQQPEILRKPVQAVHMAIVGGQLNKTQRLAFNAMLKYAHDLQAKNPGTVFDEYKIPRVQLMQMIGYTSPNRKHLKETLSKMQDMKVQWDVLRKDGDKEWASCVLLPLVGFSNDYIRYAYMPAIKPMLFDPNMPYARLDLSIQRKFKLDCAAALYEWVNRFRTNPSKVTNEAAWQHWRWMIYGEVDENSSLHEYKMFKRDKLKPAIFEINEVSDLTVTLIENKDGGRSVKLLQFKVEEKPKLLEESEQSGQDGDPIDIVLKEMDLSERDRRAIARRYSAEVILAHHQFTIKRMKDPGLVPLKKPGAYFKRAIEAGYALDMVKAPVTPTQSADSLQAIQTEFTRHRNEEAMALFNEMDSDDQASNLAEYNGLQVQRKLAAAVVPDDPKKRQQRHMSPFYAWFANKTWGEPSAQEIFKFAVDRGAIKLS